MKLSKKILAIGILGGLFLVGCTPKEKVSSVKEEVIEINVSAAASLKEAMSELESEFKKENKNIKLVTNFGASGSLQKQIEQGAPCDVFISAGEKQMKSLNDQGLIIKDTYKPLVKNELVAITEKSSEINSLEELTSNKVKHMALGEPNSVPAGKYADEVITKLGIKESLNEKLVFAKDVKEVLAWTQSKNADVGFVYLSDTINVKDIKVIEKIDEKYHSPITYPVAVTTSSKKSEEAKAFENFLLSKKGQDILVKNGYKSIL